MILGEDSLYTSDAQPLPKPLRPCPSTRPELPRKIADEAPFPRKEAPAFAKSWPPTPSRSSGHMDSDDDEVPQPRKKKNKVDPNYWKCPGLYIAGHVMVVQGVNGSTKDLQVLPAQG